MCLCQEGKKFSFFGVLQIREITHFGRLNVGCFSRRDLVGRRKTPEGCVVWKINGARKFTPYDLKRRGKKKEEL